MTQPETSGGMVWAYGIKQPGWYVAATEWSESYAEHLRSLGYTVDRSMRMPDYVPGVNNAV